MEVNLQGVRLYMEKVIQIPIIKMINGIKHLARLLKNIFWAHISECRFGLIVMLGIIGSTVYIIVVFRTLTQFLHPSLWHFLKMGQTTQNSLKLSKESQSIIKASRKGALDDTCKKCIKLCTTNFHVHTSLNCLRTWETVRVSSGWLKTL